MLRAPMFVACLVLTALALAGLASGPVQAAPGRAAFLAEPASAGGCPYLGDREALALPPGHPPIPGLEGGARGLPPGHPPVGRATPPPAPRFDRAQTIDL